MLGPTLRGARVTLRAPDERDVALFAAWRADPEVRRFTRLRWLLARGTAGWVAETARDDRVVAWTIVVDGVAAGVTAIAEIDRASGRARTHIMIGDRGVWRRGIASEAIELRTRYAFEEFGLRTLWSATASGNLAMRHALARAGYREVESGARWTGALAREEWARLRWRFTPGEAIAWRSVDRAQRAVGYTWPWTVVRDDPELIVLFLRPGAVAKGRSGERGGPRDRFLVRWDGGYRDNVWSRVNVLMLHQPADAHSVWLACDAETWAPAWWYVNLEEPWRRTPIGFDSRDLVLDLWAKPDRREWHWKDEDELVWAVGQGLIGEREAAAVRSEGERALERVRRWEAPLNLGWESWRPEPAWRIPVLPNGWERYDVSDPKLDGSGAS